MSGTNGHDGKSERYSWLRRAGPLVAALGTIALVAAACGGGSSHGPGVARARGTTTTVASSGASGSRSSGTSRQSELLHFSKCMRSHGVPNFPDLSVTGGILNGLAHSGVNPETPAFQSALQACKKYNAAGNLTPAQSAAQNAEGLQFSQCMRSHGVPNYPDPTTGPLGEQVINLHGTGIDPTSPTYQAANQACQRLFPGSK